MWQVCLHASSPRAVLPKMCCCEVAEGDAAQTYLPELPSFSWLSFYMAQRSSHAGKCPFLLRRLLWMVKPRAAQWVHLAVTNVESRCDAGRSMEEHCIFPSIAFQFSKCLHWSVVRCLLFPALRCVCSKVLSLMPMISTFLLSKWCVFQKVWQIQQIAFSSEFSEMLEMCRDTVAISKSKFFALIWNQSHFWKVERISIWLQ